MASLLRTSEASHAWQIRSGRELTTERVLTLHRDTMEVLVIISTIRYKKVKFKILKAQPKVVQFITRRSRCMVIMEVIITRLVWV